VTADTAGLLPPPGAGTTAQRVLAATWRASRSPWIWTPAAVGTAGVATATVALGRLITTPPATFRTRVLPWPLQLTAGRDGTVTLTGPAASVPGRWGVEYPGGCGEVGEVERTGQPDVASRAFTRLAGDPPAGTVHARLNAAVWPDRETFSATTGIAGSDTIVQGETGPLPAWLFPAGDGRRWSVLVHGRGASRAQLLRLVPLLHRAGITALVISYRNDTPACTDPSGRMHFGLREWRDLEAAVTVAITRGAQDVVLAGMSMGGGIIATFLRRSALASSCVAAILDAPALNWGPILRHVARGRRVPQWLVPGVMTAAALQARIDWSALNHLADDSPLTAPVLLIHGDRDPVVPIELSEAYALAQPERVEYLRVAGAGHVSSWNTDHESYAAAVATFLAGLTG
jgi:uncharacterized protein